MFADYSLGKLQTHGDTLLSSTESAQALIYQDIYKENQLDAV